MATPQATPSVVGGSVNNYIGKNRRVFLIFSVCPTATTTSLVNLQLADNTLVPENVNSHSGNSEGNFRRDEEEAEDAAKVASRMEEVVFITV